MVGLCPRRNAVDKMHEAGLYDDFTKKGHRRPGDPHLRVKELDRDGVDAEVIYGILAACGKMENREAANEMLRIYNNFMNNFCNYYPDREIGLACLPYSDIDAAAAEVHRVAKLGMKGGSSCRASWHMTPDVASNGTRWGGVNEETQLPHFHTFPATDPKLRASLTGNTLRAMTYSGCRSR